VSATTSQPPLPRQPIGATFTVALSLLGLVAALQVLAVIFHYVPVVRQYLKEQSLNESQTAEAPPAPTPDATQRVQPAPPSADAQKVQMLFSEADRSFRVGNFDAALQALEQLEGLTPGDPKVLFSKAQVLEKLDRQAEAVVVLEEVLRLPNLAPEYRGPVRKKLDTISESLGGAPARTGEGSGNTADIPAEAERLRNEVGIPAGATLGIVDVRLRDGNRGMKSLNVAVKALPNVEITGEKVKILVYFYERTDEGDVILTESKIVSQWKSPPIDWAEDEPELLEVQYAMPDGDAGRDYVGYIVGLYYDGALQDFRSEPGKLVKDFPLPLDDQ
jgi:tetratricopeptide (TPR) repeat protein